MPNPITMPRLFLLMAKYPLSRSNSQVTMMAISFILTAHYGGNLICLLIAKGCKVCVLNPLKTSTIRKNNVRKTNTDKVDTFVIAKILTVQDSLRYTTLADLDYIELKKLGRFRQKTIKQRTRLKMQLISYVD